MSARKYWLGFNVIKGIGPVRLRALQSYFGDLEPAWTASERDLLAAGLDRRTISSFLQARNSIQLDQLSDDLDRIGAAALTLDDADYPALLRELPDAPPVLYIKGIVLDMDRWAVAFVGTRRATVYGRDVTRELIEPLVHAGITIVSGLALGIDAAAHKAALDAGGRTLAVLGCGIDMVYPPEHRHLAAEIVQNGALVTEFPPGTQPEGKNFPVRNRTISGLSLGVVVVEAPESSGALLTADIAAEQGRDVFAVPGNITARTSRGTNRLIQSGAKLVNCAEDIMDELNLTRSAVEVSTTVREIAPADETEQALLAYLDSEPVHIDDLCQRTGLPITRVSSALALMELKGMVSRQEGMSYVRSRGGTHYRLD
ncbi:MAG TPA: DNA-processing protein DprA [Aggregatilinea sp.]|uniref:DNA-processing protein DprA n=1 Tax=Aggregatilinea sp. TaxID=2806333 RepID=UPI002B8DFA8C|nr:DNA-processing protein DprA [Aggregatilinea sp.]HML20786.1 DNA-processing protein DprA [Aggregatilinea sp.]